MIPKKRTPIRVSFSNLFALFLILPVGCPVWMPEQEVDVGEGAVLFLDVLDILPVVVGELACLVVYLDETGDLAELVVVEDNAEKTIENLLALIFLLL